MHAAAASTPTLLRYALAPVALSALPSTSIDQLLPYMDSIPKIEHVALSKLPSTFLPAGKSSAVRQACPY
jgi:hypothetical protein